MKKKILALIIVVVFVFTGCKNADNVNTSKCKASTLMIDARYGSISTFKDPQTGVWYIVNIDGGITPRLNGDGTLYCE